MDKEKEKPKEITLTLTPSQVFILGRVVHREYTSPGWDGDLFRDAVLDMEKVLDKVLYDTLSKEEIDVLWHDLFN